MRTSYHNTTGVEGRQLKAYEDKALSQEERLLAYFSAHLPRVILLTPSAALERVFSDSVPITSVRRALSNLTRDNQLIKSGQAMGKYGRPEYYWRLPRQQLELL